MSQQAYTTTLGLKDPGRYNVQTVGNETDYANLWFDLGVVRVGKANTLLIVPNDWSTLTNGTVDGVPSGLHRYVGEQRFVFGLLNVTDGDGDLVSYDIESRIGGPGGFFYADSSGNGLDACHAGDSRAAGYFGDGARLSGSGSYLEACGDSVPILTEIDTAFTVAFWVKPETDYVDGAGWAWSFGRQDLWRLGFYNPAQGVRFAVTDTSNNVHAIEAVHPLYTDRWVHLAASMRSGSGWTNLSLFVNGQIVAWTNGTDFTAKDGNSYLYLGWDEAAGPSAGHFRGIVDEFRLYGTGLPQDGVRGA